MQLQQRGMWWFWSQSSYHSSLQDPFYDSHSNAMKPFLILKSGVKRSLLLVYKDPKLVPYGWRTVKRQDKKIVDIWHYCSPTSKFSCSLNDSLPSHPHIIKYLLEKSTTLTEFWETSAEKLTSQNSCFRPVTHDTLVTPALELCWSPCAPNRSAPAVACLVPSSCPGRALPRTQQLRGLWEVPLLQSLPPQAPSLQHCSK